MEFFARHYNGMRHGLADFTVREGGSQIEVISLDQSEREELARDLVNGALDVIGTNSPKYESLQDFFNEWAAD